MRDRYFEKVSYKEFQRSICSDKKMYDNYKLPRRATRGSCGYDFYAIRDLIIKPSEVVKIATGIRAKFLPDEVLLLVVRSSMGFKYNVRMCNQVGVIDSDYYGNSSNEGHIYIALQNEGDSDYVIKAGDAFCQGIFLKYLTCSDDVSGVRVGGIGSSNKEVMDNE